MVGIPTRTWTGLRCLGVWDNGKHRQHPGPDRRPVHRFVGPLAGSVLVPGSPHWVVEKLVAGSQRMAIGERESAEGGLRCGVADSDR